MKYFIFSDIHGFFDQLMTELTNQGFDRENPDHCIISCGDLLDRGEQPRECLKFVNELYNEGRAILIKGNHEVLMEEMLERGYPLKHDYSNGTMGTLMSMFPSCNNIESIWAAMSEDKDWQTYQSHLIDFYETNTHIFVHGWIPTKWKYAENGYVHKVYDHDWRTTEGSDDAFLKWDSYPSGARWLNGIDCWNKGLNQTGKTIVVGHYHCSYGWSHIDQKYKEFPQKTHEDFNNSFQPYIKDGLIALDGCTAYSGKVNVITIEE